MNKPASITARLAAKQAAPVQFPELDRPGMTTAERIAAKRAKAASLMRQASTIRNRKISLPLMGDAAALRIEADALQEIVDFGEGLGPLAEDTAGWEPV